MKLFNILVGAVFLPGLVAVPLGGWVLYGDVTQDSARSYFVLACRAVQWDLAVVTADELGLTGDCSCIGDRVAGGLPPREKVPQAEAVRAFMMESVSARHDEAKAQTFAQSAQLAAFSGTAMGDQAAMSALSNACPK